jgi:hypothetical protein
MISSSSSFEYVNHLHAVTYFLYDTGNPEFPYCHGGTGIILEDDGGSRYFVTLRHCLSSSLSPSLIRIPINKGSACYGIEWWYHCRDQQAHEPETVLEYGITELTVFKLIPRPRVNGPALPLSHVDRLLDTTGMCMGRCIGFPSPGGFNGNHIDYESPGYAYRPAILYGILDLTQPFLGALHISSVLAGVSDLSRLRAPDADWTASLNGLCGGGAFVGNRLVGIINFGGGGLVRFHHASVLRGVLEKSLESPFVN